MTPQDNKDQLKAASFNVSNTEEKSLRKFQSFDLLGPEADHSFLNNLSALFKQRVN